MSAVAVTTLVLVGILVVALALYLVRIVFILRHANDRLGKITFGVRAIAHQVEPVNELTDGINANLGAVADALDQLIADVTAVDENAA